MNLNKDMKETKFKCYSCGKCCENIKDIDIYKYLDNGRGICRFYNKTEKKCKIYEIRPLICNIDRMYELYYHKIISKENYYLINKIGCKKLKGGI